jgi:hypothetical protein
VRFVGERVHVADTATGKEVTFAKGADCKIVGWVRPEEKGWWSRSAKNVGALHLDCATAEGGRVRGTILLDDCEGG